MQEVIYKGPLRICKTKWGQFVRGTRVHLDDLVAQEVLKLPGFFTSSFAACFLGPQPERKLKVQGGKILTCKRGVVVDLPSSIAYKIRHDLSFALGSRTELTQKIVSQKVEQEKKRRADAHAKKSSAPPVVEKPKVVEEIPIPIASLDLSIAAKRILKSVGFEYVSDLPSEKELLAVNGVGKKTIDVVKVALGNVGQELRK